MTCNYCLKLATSRIPAVHGDTCLAHTIEFWTGFLTYAKEHPFAAPVAKAPAAARPTMN